MTSARSPKRATTERINLNISTKTATTLRRLSKQRGTTMTETIRRAVAVLDFLETQLEGGGELQIVEPDGLVRQLAII
jgi:hypothetical protein